MMVRLKALDVSVTAKFVSSCLHTRSGLQPKAAWLRTSASTPAHVFLKTHAADDALSVRRPNCSGTRTAPAPASFFGTAHPLLSMPAQAEYRGMAKGLRAFGTSAGGTGSGDQIVKGRKKPAEIDQLDRQLKEIDDLHDHFNRKRVPIYETETEELVKLNATDSGIIQPEDVAFLEDDFMNEPDRADVEMSLRFNCMVKGSSEMGLQRQKPFPFKFHKRVQNRPVPRPKRIILIRHGESEGNRDELLYTQQPDWRIPLSKDGLYQSKFAGQEVKNIVGNEDVYLYHSPYSRTVQSCQQIMHALDPAQVRGIREEPRIAEQQFGNLQDLVSLRRSKIERRKYGRFFYRFPNGEAGLDVYSRISSFIGTIRRDHLEEDCTVVIVTHGLALRLFLMRWFQWTVEQFESTHNPPNCGVAVMNRNPEDGRYTLTTETLHMIGADKAPTTSAIGRSMLRKAYCEAFLSYGQY